jgi:peptidoglycan/LPS O-acetylase OafA/YrhL
VLATIAGLSVIGVLGARAGAGIMTRILRDVSALDRQHLAHLEIRPPTAIERAIARLIGGAAALPYGKDARLMRRRYPMAFALGALAFLVLAIVGLARPADPAPWLTAAIGGSAIYALALASRRQ